MKAGRKRRERERERHLGTKFVFLALFLRHLETSPSIPLQLLSIRNHGMYYSSHWQYYIRVHSGSKLFANVNREKERDRAFARSDQRLYTVLIRKMCASCIVGRCKKLIKFLTTHCRSEVISNMRTVFQEEKYLDISYESSSTSRQFT